MAEEAPDPGTAPLDRAAATLQQLLLVLRGSQETSPPQSARSYEEPLEESPTRSYEEPLEESPTRSGYSGEAPPAAPPAPEDFLKEVSWANFVEDDNASLVHSRPTSGNPAGGHPPPPPPPLRAPPPPPLRAEWELDPGEGQDGEADIGWDQELTPSDAGQVVFLPAIPEVGTSGAAPMEATLRPTRRPPSATSGPIWAPRDPDEIAAARARSGRQCFVELLQKLVGITQGQHGAFLPDGELQAIRDNLEHIAARLDVFTQFLEEMPPVAVEATGSSTVSAEEPFARQSLQRTSTLALTKEELWAKEAEVEAKSQELRRLESRLSQREKELAVKEQLLQRRLQTTHAAAVDKQDMLASRENKVPTPPLVHGAEPEEIHSLKLLNDAVQAKKAHEKELEDYSDFSRAIAESSAGSSLPSKLNFDTADMLGMGHYGYVFLCQESKAREKIVVKVQSTRWMDVAAHEWATASKLGTCENIVKIKEVILHRDVDQEVQRLLEANFENGTLTGRKPQRWPSLWVALFSEYADAGSLQHLMDKRLLDAVEGTGAVATQVANALSFMHQKRMTHNDVKPENILLCRKNGSDGLVAKLADLGLAQHSTDRSRDAELHAYTIWCAGLLQQFQSCPNQDEQRSYLQQWNEKSLRGASQREQQIWQQLATVLLGLWKGTLDMHELCQMDSLLTCEVRVAASHSEQLEDFARNEIKRRSILDVADAKSRLSLLRSQSSTTVSEEV